MDITTSLSQVYVLHYINLSIYFMLQYFLPTLRSAFLVILLFSSDLRNPCSITCFILCNTQQITAQVTDS